MSPSNILLFFCLFGAANAIVFNINQVGLSGFGSIYSSLYTQLYPYASEAIFGTNQTMVIALDIFGCNPSLGGPLGTSQQVFV